MLKCNIGHDSTKFAQSGNFVNWVFNLVIKGRKRKMLRSWSTAIYDPSALTQCSKQHTHTSQNEPIGTLWAGLVPEKFLAFGWCRPETGATPDQSTLRKMQDFEFCFAIELGLVQRKSILLDWPLLHSCQWISNLSPIRFHQAQSIQFLVMLCCTESRIPKFLFHQEHRPGKQYVHLHFLQFVMWNGQSKLRQRAFCWRWTHTRLNVMHNALAVEFFFDNPSSPHACHFCAHTRALFCVEAMHGQKLWKLSWVSKWECATLQTLSGGLLSDLVAGEVAAVVSGSRWPNQNTDFQGWTVAFTSVFLHSQIFVHCTNGAITQAWSTSGTRRGHVITFWFVSGTNFRLRSLKATYGQPCSRLVLNKQKLLANLNPGSKIQMLSLWSLLPSNATKENINSFPSCTKDLHPPYLRLVLLPLLKAKKLRTYHFEQTFFCSLHPFGQKHIGERCLAKMRVLLWWNNFIAHNNNNNRYWAVRGLAVENPALGGTKKWTSRNPWRLHHPPDVHELTDIVLTEGKRRKTFWVTWTKQHNSNLCATHRMLDSGNSEKQTSSGQTFWHLASELIGSLRRRESEWDDKCHATSGSRDMVCIVMKLIIIMHLCSAKELKLHGFGAQLHLKASSGFSYF